MNFSVFSLKGKELNYIGVALSAFALVRISIDILQLHINGFLARFLKFYNESIREPISQFFLAFGVNVEPVEVWLIIGIVIATTIRSITHFGVKDIIGKYKEIYGVAFALALFNVIRITLENIAKGKISGSGVNYYFDIFITILFGPFLLVFIFSNIIGIFLLTKDVFEKIFIILNKKKILEESVIVKENYKETSGMYYRALTIYTFATLAICTVAIVMGSYGG